MPDPLDVTEEGPLRRLTLDRPDKRNALNPPLLDALVDAVEGVRDAGARALLVDANGPAFSAGGDVADMRERSGDPLATHDRQRNRFGALARTLLEAPVPTVAAVDGPAHGAGASLALLCDEAHLSNEAALGFGFRNMALAPDTGASWLLPRMVGLQAARRLVLRGETADAAEARDLGLATAVHNPEDLEAAVDEAAQALAQGPTRALVQTRRALLRGASSGPDEALAHEAAAQGLCFALEDHHEAVTAFLDGDREPEFEGR